MERAIIGALTLEPIQDAADSPIKLFWRGKSIDREPSQTLNPFMTSIVGEARAAGVPLELHLEPLERLNSSTVAYIIQIVQLTRESSVKLVIVFDPKVKWQKLSLEPLGTLRTDPADDTLELRCAP